MMHVCMTYHYFRPHFGGLEEHVYYLSKFLVKEGIKVSVITSNVGENKADIRPNFEIIDGIEVVRLKAIPWIFRTLKLENFSEALKTIDPDIFHAHHPIPGISDKTVFYAKKNDYKTVVTYHADSQEDTLLSKIAARIYYRTIGKRMIEKADKVIATTKSYAETSPVLSKFMKKVEIIPNGIDVKRFNPKVNGEEIREKYRLQEKIVVLGLGRFVPYKGFEYLVRTMQNLNDDFVLILAGEGILRKNLENLAKKLNLERRVIFTGFIKEEKKPKYYAACDVFVLPSISRGEAFSITLLEAMACGKPVVATNLAGVNEIARLGGISVSPKDSKELARAIILMSQRKTNVRKQYNLIEKKFSWDKVVKKTLKIYESLV